MKVFEVPLSFRKRLFSDAEIKTKEISTLLKTLNVCFCFYSGRVSIKMQILLFLNNSGLFFFYILTKEFHSKDLIYWVSRKGYISVNLPNYIKWETAKTRCSLFYWRKYCSLEVWINWFHFCHFLKVEAYKNLFSKGNL